MKQKPPTPSSIFLYADLTNSMKPPASHSELRLQGLPASPGIAIGPALCFRRHVTMATPTIITPEQVARELKRFHDSITRSLKELERIKQTAHERIGPQASAIFEAKIMMLND